MNNRFQGLRHRFRPLFICWILIMWILLMGELSWANVLGGLIVGLLVTMLLPLPAMPVAGLHIHWGKLLAFLGSWLVDFIQASFKVAWLAIRPAEPPRSAILQAPMRVDSEFVLSVAVLLYNLQPGGSVSEIDIAERMLTVHVLDADNEAAIARELEAVAKLERNLIAVFERTV